MDENQNGSSQNEEVGEVQVRVAPGIHLTKEQEALMAQAFAREEVVLVKEEFRSGYSGALVVLVSVGTGRAPVVVKLAHPHDLQNEYDAYEQFVRQISPQNIAHLQGEPLVASDGQLGLIQYTFAGGESHLPTNSLQKYYESNGAEGMSAVLNRIFRVFGRHWWANNRAQSYVLDEYYDRLLPVHLQAAMVDSASTPDHVITAGETSVLIVQEIEIGQVIKLVGFDVTKARDDGRRITLLAAPPHNEASAPLRIRVESNEPSSHCPGSIVESLTVRVTATRMTLLGEAAQEALPGFDPLAKQFTLSADGGEGIVLLNPLLQVPEWLYTVVETKMSIIHGDLNLQNVLVDAPTGFSWLIDFAETREGPTLLDLQRLEVQVITKLLPQEGKVPLGAVAEMMTRLHADPPLPAPPQPVLQEPYKVLATIRRLARQYLMDDLDWNEYYYGLITALVGALKYDELDDTARRLALVSAAAASSLIGQPLQTHPVTDSTQTDILPVVPATTAAAASIPPQMELQAASPRSEPAAAPVARSQSRRWVGIGVAAIAVLLVVLIGWQLAGRVSSPETGSASGDGQSAAAVLSPTAAGDEAAAAAVEPTQTPTVTPSPAEPTPTEPQTTTPSPQATATEAETDAVAGAAGTGTPSGGSTVAGATDAGTPISTPSPAPTSPPATPTSPPTVTPTPSPLPPIDEEATLKTLVPLNVRSGPGTEYPIVGSLRAAAVADLLGRTAGNDDVWYQVAFPAGGTELAWVTGNPNLVEVSGSEDVPVVAISAIPTRPPTVAAPTGTIYFSATDSSGNDNVYRTSVSGAGDPVLVVRRARQPVQSPDNQVLAFKSILGNALGIAGLDESSQNRVLYSSNPEDSVPSWSPDGSRVVYASNLEGDRKWRLYVTSASAGGGYRELALGADPDWHPSRDQIVYRGCDSSGGRCGLWTVTSSGASPTPLTTNPSDARPRWSPDGQSVVFMSLERDGNWELYQVEVATGSVERITDNPANDGLPAISPDGRQVAFLSNRNGRWGIWSTGLSGGTPRRIVSLDEPLPDWLVQGIDWAK